MNINRNQDELFMKILKNTRSSEIDYFLICNYDTIKKALDINVSIKTIYKTVVHECGFKISYSNFINKIKKIIINNHNQNNLPLKPNENLTLEISHNHIQNQNDEAVIISKSLQKFKYDNTKM